MSQALEILTQLGSEAVLYVPQTGASRTIQALVERRPARPNGLGGFTYPERTIELYVVKSASEGMASIVPTQDKVQTKLDLDDTSTSTFRVTKILEQDAGMGEMPGMWKLEAVI